MLWFLYFRSYYYCAVVTVIFHYSLESTVASDEALSALQNDYERLQKKYSSARKVVLVCTGIFFRSIFC